ncbi:hypothetical protein K458DRAFT_490625 [Lentithecium fluviatile CBS 122367]|uniref:Uncharacterized protein n=1 Tax=Lentithecium fluviatile CBS 122367 TaxID=1168545 RepID=A0A6G1IM54_9PLEO|nr:hypothetical protein K458DRAFT_490625 [Lentithecium fluviatile CBS 122367]
MTDSLSNGNAAQANGDAAPMFTEREMQMLGFAMLSLKSGPPEIDYEKLAKFAGMTNHRSAGNAWAKIKTKLVETIDGGAAPATPKRGGAKKKAAAKDGSAEGEGADGESPTKKTPRKRAAKKQEVDGGETSPKKKGRAAAKGKKGADKENAEAKTEVEKKASEDEFKDLEPNGDSKTNGAAASVADAEEEV